MVSLHRSALAAPRALLPRFRAGRWMVVLAGCALVAAALFQVNQFSRLTSTSYEINALNQQRAARQAQNHELAADVARLSSLARVDIEARVRLHMEPAQQKLFVNVNQPVPDRESLPTRFLPPDRPQAASAGSPWWSELLRVVPGF